LASPSRASRASRSPDSVRSDSSATTCEKQTEEDHSDSDGSYDSRHKHDKAKAYAGGRAPGGGGGNTIFPRRKAGQHARTSVKPVVLTESALSPMFSLPLHEAAARLGISATALKSACRKLNIKKWPYRTVQSAKNQRAGVAHSGPSSGDAVRRPKTASAGKHRGAATAATAATRGCCGDSATCSAASGDLRQDARLLAETVFLLNQNVRRQAHEIKGARNEFSPVEEAGAEGGAGVDAEPAELAKTSSISLLLN